MNKERNSIGVQVGGATEHTAKALPAVAAAIQKVLDSSAGDDVKKAAIAALRDVGGGAHVSGVSLSGCHIGL